MLARIEAHNRLNGYALVIVEFVLIGSVVGGFGIYYAAHGRPVEAVLAFGIVANAAVIVILGLRSVFRGEKGVGLWRVYTDAAVRRQVMQENPKLSQDSVLIAGAVLVPFLLVVAAAWPTRH